MGHNVQRPDVTNKNPHDAWPFASAPQTLGDWAADMVGLEFLRRGIFAACSDSGSPIG